MTRRWLQIALLAAALPGPPARAAEDPALVVPACDRAIVLSLPMPDRLRPSFTGPCRLVEPGAPGPGTPAEIIAQHGAGATAARQGRVLAAVIAPAKGTAPRRFTLRAGPVAGKVPFAFKDISEKSLGLYDAGKPVLVYNHGVMSRPGVDRRNNRSNYLHPVYGLDGEVLTDDFPKDHRHHRGVFWAWPYLYPDVKRRRNVESWVPARLHYRFERWTCLHRGAVAAAFGVETSWLADKKPIVRERLGVVVHRRAGDARCLDVDLTWTAIGRPVALRGRQGKGYGGFSFRFAPRADTVVTTGSGRTRGNLIGRKLAWADLSGKFAGATGHSGAAVFVSPDHRPYPPDATAEQYGVIYIGWPGLAEARLEPGKPVRRRYRVWIHRGAPEAKELAKAYEAYTRGALARWVRPTPRRRPYP